jgi:phosphoribosyl-AMP cyclohydrolase
MLLEDINDKVGWKDIFTPTIWTEIIHEINNDNGVGVVNFVISKNLTVKIIMFPHSNFHKFTWTSPDGKTHNQIDYILIVDTSRRRRSVVLDIRSFRTADCDTDHYLVVAKVKDKLEASEKTKHRPYIKEFNLKKLSALKDKDQYRVKVS